MPPDTLWKCGLSIQSVTLLKSAGYLRGSPANSGPVDFASEKSFPLNFVH